MPVVLREDSPVNAWNGKIERQYCVLWSKWNAWRVSFALVFNTNGPLAAHSTTLPTKRQDKYMGPRRNFICKAVLGAIKLSAHATDQSVCRSSNKQSASHNFYVRTTGWELRWRAKAREIKVTGEHFASSSWGQHGESQIRTCDCQE